MIPPEEVKKREPLLELREVGQLGDLLPRPEGVGRLRASS